MILLISTCLHMLSEKEFVGPLKRLLSVNRIDFEVKKYTELIEPERYDRIIICGTALKDFEYIKSVNNFSWLKECGGSVLGICSGAQIITKLFGSSLEDETIIGKKEVAIKEENMLARGSFESYFLISKKPKIEGNFFSLDKDGYIFKHREKEIYGILFHPEVLNEEIILNFSK